MGRCWLGTRQGTNRIGPALGAFQLSSQGDLLVYFGCGLTEAFTASAGSAGFICQASPL